MNLVRSQNLTVAGVVIHRDDHGRFSLNDFHAASGVAASGSPNRFLRLDSTLALIDEISNCPDMGNIIPVKSRAGRYGGTFAVKELVYAYANWISPAFYLKVIRTYDAMVTGNLDAVSDLLPRATMKQVGGMVKAVTRKQIDESIADTLARVIPSMVRAEMANTHMSVRRGLTAGECWKIHGLPTKGLRGYSKWFGHRLTEVGCLMSDGRGELGLSTARLFDPDRVAAFMRGGFKATCERYIRERLGQKSLFSIAS